MIGWGKHEKYYLQKQTDEIFLKIRYLIFFIFSNYIFRAPFILGLKKTVHVMQCALSFPLMTP